MKIIPPKRRPRSFLIFIFGFYSLIFFKPSVLFGQPSVIDTTQKALPSLVSITAENISAAPSPMHHGIDKNTGKLVAFQNVKTAIYERSGAGMIIDA